MRGITCSPLIRGLCFAIGASCCLAQQSLAAPPRQPLPDAADITAAQDLVRQAYEDDFKTAATDPEPLIRKLLAAAEETQDPASDYVLFLEAEKAAVAGGAVGRAMEVVDARADQFEIDGLQTRVERIADCLTPKTRADVGLLKVLWDHAVETAERGLAEEAFPQAKKAAEAAGNVAKAIFAAGRTRKDEALLADAEEKLAQARDLAKTIGRRSSLLTEYRKATEKLASDADDPKANGVVGRYLCFERDAWAEGLPALAKGDQQNLAAAAASEIAVFSGEAEQPDPREILAVADEWWQASEADAARRHAAALYERVLPEIGDPTKRALATKRIAAANPEGEPQREPAKGPVVTKKPPSGRRPALAVPASTVLPVPAEISADLVPLLLTEDEVTTLQNRLNVADDELAAVRVELWRRIHSGFGIAKWTTVDALYLVELNDRLSGLLGRYEWRTSTGKTIGGRADAKDRNECKTAIAVAWILASKSEAEFVGRARALPAGVLERPFVEQYLNESEVKRWLVGLGEDYAPIPRKAQALDSLIQAGVATPGMLRYREELGRAVATGQR
jgi:hypothetical protein